ncbi:Mobile element protein [Rhodovulum sp. PH10]|uniref:integrase core domain-containing protein n=1 Tax=Rhodovulum sp. PH10 TaxID=1187851 RepID=UPI00027C2290|nr:Mobile element protein [Rhodovulum sp. PH10]
MFIERSWRSLKHEDVYLKHYTDGREAKAGIAAWITFYNERRLHQALGYRTPMTVWRAGAASEAVDMLDNAAALPPSPQPQTKRLAA